MLRRLIAHEIKKQLHSKTADLHLRDKVLPVALELSESLLNQLRDSFVSRNPTIGKFRSIAATQPRFQQLLIPYFKGATDETFVQFTKDSMAVLKDEIIKQPLATGGYVIFGEFDSANAAFLMTAILSTQAQPTFDENLNLIASTTLDLQHLRHGARCRLEWVEDNRDGVVHFISAGAKGVSEYFLEFIGCEAITRPDVQANRLYSALNDWAEKQKLGEEEKWDLMGRTHSHWADCKREKRQMTLSGIANVLAPQDPGPLLTHLGQEGLDLAGEFTPPPPGSMKRFVRFSFRASGLTLEFDRNQWQDKIKVDATTRTLTIQDAPLHLIAALAEE